MHGVYKFNLNLKFNLQATMITTNPSSCLSFIHILLIIISTMFMILNISSSQPIEFVYNGFNGTSNLVATDGSTQIQSNGALRLTDTTKNVIGHAFYPSPIPMINNNNKTNSIISSFSTYFVFQVNPSSGNRGGYGFAFTLSPLPSFIGAEPKHYLGVFNSTNDGNSSNHIFLVEFDTVNGYRSKSDSDGNHIGVNINGMLSKVTRSAEFSVNGTKNNEDFNLESGSPIQAWIDYDGLTKLLNVTVCPINVVKPSLPLISEIIELSSVVRDNMYVGFSSATGEISSSHYILGWSFSMNGTAEALDLTKLPVVAMEIESTSNIHRVKKALIATFSVLLFILVSLGSIVLYRRVMKFEDLEEWELECPRRFRYRDLHKATKGFKESEIIGAGGFGAVYKGVSPANGAEIAVKKISAGNALQGMREFAAEIESLGRLRHKNLVNLQGWCKHKTDLLLVYDYIPNGSLDSLLYNSKNGSHFLNWEQRHMIIKGIASGLLYLHEEWEQVVVHRDVKSNNVLIDREMNPKLGDFGLARLYDHGKNSHTTNVVGTIGYIAPELTQTGRASTKTDVFSFGILLLEIACGRAPVVHKAERNVILVDWVVECVQLGNVFDAVDAKLDSVYKVEEMELVLGLGLLCSHPRPEARPDMRQVVKYLNGDEVLPIFDALSSVGSRRVEEITSRFLGLDLSQSVIESLCNSSSMGEISSSSLDHGR